jgi:hypothetical protein
MTTNMPWAVYRCDLIRRGETPRNEVFISGHLSAFEAMDEANRLKRSDRRHSYTVGAA